MTIMQAVGVLTVMVGLLFIILLWTSAAQDKKIDDGLAQLASELRAKIDAMPSPKPMNLKQELEPVPTLEKCAICYGTGLVERVEDAPLQRALNASVLAAMKGKK